ncbi:MAG: cryptochrome/photolyase family protein [Planctomycetota bacterium]
MRILHWFRKDLRLDDNTSLAAASADSRGEVAICYISEPSVLRRADMAACRVAFALNCLKSLSGEIARLGGRLMIRHGNAHEEIVNIAKEIGADAVYWNCEYEPQLVERDRKAKDALESANIKVRAFHDRLLAAPGAVTTKEGNPYTVFTPFERSCEKIEIAKPRPHVAKFISSEIIRKKAKTLPLATADKLGFHTHIQIPDGGEANATKRLYEFCDRGLENYKTARDFMHERGTSRLSADLKFGTISVRTIVKNVIDAARAKATIKESAEKFISELRWRDFYTHILYNFPRVEKGSFKKEYDTIAWDDNDRLLNCWKAGATGYPVVDAAMRELRATGWMHNRARMIVASFFTKDLGLDWRLGERHFMNELLDGDLANNNGGWQWAASTGTDAAPYFRIFNPVLQGKRFDPGGEYVKKWCPELVKLPADHIHSPWDASPLALAEAGVCLGRDYPKPCVDHATARVRAIARFEAAVKSSRGPRGNKK